MHRKSTQLCKSRFDSLRPPHGLEPVLFTPQFLRQHSIGMIRCLDPLLTISAKNFRFRSWRCYLLGIKQGRLTLMLLVGEFFFFFFMFYSFAILIKQLAKHPYSTKIVSQFCIYLFLSSEIR